MKSLVLLSYIVLFSILPSFAQTEVSLNLAKEAGKEFAKALNKDSSLRYLVDKSLLNKVVLQSVEYRGANKTLEFKFNSSLSQMPLHPEQISVLYALLKSKLDPSLQSLNLQLYVEGDLIEYLTPNYYRPSPAFYDLQRTPFFEKTITSGGRSSLERQSPAARPEPLVKNLSAARPIVRGLQNRYIALWNSHGFHFDYKENRWMWQRSRLFQTVEDLLTTSYVLPFLTPMLENAGAHVFLPRERDTQTNEVIIDNDMYAGSTNNYVETNADGRWQTGEDAGFAVGKPPYLNENPFRMGTYSELKGVSKGRSSILYIPNLPEKGYYAVYISYRSLAKSTTKAHYSVYHLGGRTDFEVNQQMGGSTWIYLGRFLFPKGTNEALARVELTNETNDGGMVTADAVRFGGGMGSVSRGGAVSGKPRWCEAALYSLQYAGMPAEVLDVNKETNDYKNDLHSRGEWVNYLSAPVFSNLPDSVVPEKTSKKDKKKKLIVETKKTVKQTGLGIPLDLSFALHTDAGSTDSAKYIGTLGIVNTNVNKGRFHSDMSRMANRDLADLVMSQIVSDIRTKYDTLWTRRSLVEKNYSEVWRPQVPSVLIEAFSHQNLPDMVLASDPRFKFDFSRAIYKGILRFVCTQNQQPYTVQPLPVNSLSALIAPDGSIRLSWKPVLDPLEPTAAPNRYVVYTRHGDNGFDNGQVVEATEFTLPRPAEGMIYSFKVTAMNEGGESFPSSVVAACVTKSGQKPVLIVDGFDRVSGPEAISNAAYRGFPDFLDHGVPSGYELSMTGKQFDFDPKSIWESNDGSGCGGSSSELEGKPLMGNTRDFVYLHGSAIRAAGYSFVSVNKKVLMDSLFNYYDYPTIDLLLGEERTVYNIKNKSAKDYETYPLLLQKRLQQLCDSGRNILITGAYVGSDMVKNKPKKAFERLYAKNTLKFIWRSSHASQTGLVAASDTSIFLSKRSFQFNTQASSTFYEVESPDAIDPVDSVSHCIARYADSKASAAISYQGKYRMLVFGFPLESIVRDEEREALMRDVLRFFNTVKPDGK